jgi:Na+/alanine symporter
LGGTRRIGEFCGNADMAVGLVFVPNMIALIALSPKFIKMFKEYSAALKAQQGKKIS